MYRRPSIDDGRDRQLGPAGDIFTQTDSKPPTKTSVLRQYRKPDSHQANQFPKEDFQQQVGYSEDYFGGVAGQNKMCQYYGGYNQVLTTPKIIQNPPYWPQEGVREQNNRNGLQYNYCQQKLEPCYYSEKQCETRNSPQNFQRVSPIRNYPATSPLQSFIPPNNYMDPNARRYPYSYPQKVDPKYKQPCPILEKRLVNQDNYELPYHPSRIIPPRTSPGSCRILPQTYPKWQNNWPIPIEYGANPYLTHIGHMDPLNIAPVPKIDLQKEYFDHVKLYKNMGVENKRGYNLDYNNQRIVENPGYVKPKLQYPYNVPENMQNMYRINYQRQPVVKPVEPVNPPRNISPRRTYTENMTTYEIPHPMIHHQQNDYVQYDPYQQRGPNLIRNYPQLPRPQQYPQQKIPAETYPLEHYQYDRPPVQLHDNKPTKNPETSKLNLKQFLECWEDDEELISNLPDIVLSNNLNERNYESSTSDNSDGKSNILYIYEKQLVDPEMLSKYTHIAQIDRLPDNIIDKDCITVDLGGALNLSVNRKNPDSLPVIDDAIEKNNHQSVIVQNVQKSEAAFLESQGIDILSEYVGAGMDENSNYNDELHKKMSEIHYSPTRADEMIEVLETALRDEVLQPRIDSVSKNGRARTADDVRGIPEVGRAESSNDNKIVDAMFQNKVNFDVTSGAEISFDGKRTAEVSFGNDGVGEISFDGANSEQVNFDNGSDGAAGKTAEVEVGFDDKSVGEGGFVNNNDVENCFVKRCETESTFDGRSEVEKSFDDKSAVEEIMDNKNDIEVGFDKKHEEVTSLEENSFDKNIVQEIDFTKKILEEDGFEDKRAENSFDDPVVREVFDKEMRFDKNSEEITIDEKGTDKKIVVGSDINEEMVAKQSFDNKLITEDSKKEITDEGNKDARDNDHLTEDNFDNKSIVEDLVNGSVLENNFDNKSDAGDDLDDKTVSEEDSDGKSDVEDNFNNKIALDNNVENKPIEENDFDDEVAMKSITVNNKVDTGTTKTLIDSKIDAEDNFDDDDDFIVDSGIDNKITEEGRLDNKTIENQDDFENKISEEVNFESKLSEEENFDNKIMEEDNFVNKNIVEDDFDNKIIVEDNLDTKIVEDVNFDSKIMEECLFAGDFNSGITKEVNFDDKIIDENSFNKKIALECNLDTKIDAEVKKIVEEENFNNKMVIENNFDSKIVVEEDNFDSKIIEEDIFDNEVIEENNFDIKIIEEDDFDNEIIEGNNFGNKTIEKDVFDNKIEDEIVVEEVNFDNTVVEESKFDNKISMEETFGSKIMMEENFDEKVTKEENFDNKNIVEEHNFDNKTIEKNDTDNKIVEEENIDNDIFGDDNFDDKIITEKTCNDKIVTEETFDDKIVTEENFNDEVVTEDNFDDEFVEEDNFGNRIIEKENGNNKTVVEEIFDDKIIVDVNSNNKIVEERNFDVKIAKEEKFDNKIIEEENFDDKIAEEENFDDKTVQEDNFDYKIIGEDDFDSKIIVEEINFDGKIVLEEIFDDEIIQKETFDGKMTPEVKLNNFFDVRIVEKDNSDNNIVEEDSYVNKIIDKTPKEYSSDTQIPNSANKTPGSEENAQENQKEITFVNKTITKRPRNNHTKRLIIRKRLKSVKLKKLKELRRKRWLEYRERRATMMSKNPSVSPHEVEKLKWVNPENPQATSGLLSDEIPVIIPPRRTESVSLTDGMLELDFRPKRKVEVRSFIPVDEIERNVQEAMMRVENPGIGVVKGIVEDIFAAVCDFETEKTPIANWDDETAPKEVLETDETEVVYVRLEEFVAETNFSTEDPLQVPENQVELVPEESTDNPSPNCFYDAPDIVEISDLDIAGIETVITTENLPDEPQKTKKISLESYRKRMEHRPPPPPSKPTAPKINPLNFPMLPEKYTEVRRSYPIVAHNRDPRLEKINRFSNRGDKTDEERQILRSAKEKMEMERQLQWSHPKVEYRVQRNDGGRFGDERRVEKLIISKRSIESCAEPERKNKFVPKKLKTDPKEIPKPKIAKDEDPLKKKRRKRFRNLYGSADDDDDDDNWHPSKSKKKDPDASSKTVKVQISLQALENKSNVPNVPVPHAIPKVVIKKNGSGYSVAVMRDAKLCFWKPSVILRRAPRSNNEPYDYYC